MNKVTRKKLEKWILDNVEYSNWKNNDDLHIDEISKVYNNKKNWIHGGLDCLKVSHEILQNNNLNFGVELAFHLYSTNCQIGINFHSLSDIEEDFENTPPSIYIYPLYDKKWLQIFKKGEELILKDFEDKEIKILFFESKLKDFVEYSRRLSFIYKHLQ